MDAIEGQYRRAELIAAGNGRFQWGSNGIRGRQQATVQLPGADEGGRGGSDEPITED